MSWLGYNSSNASVKILLQMLTDFSATTIPTSTDVERINTEIYSEMRIKMRKAGIAIDSITDADDLRYLSQINDMGTAGIIEKIKFGNVPNASGETNTISEPDISWNKKYEKKLKEFIEYKTINTVDYSVFGVNEELTDGEPLFGSETTW